MKLKYIFSMVAGLVVMTAISCSEKTSAEAGADEVVPDTSAEVASTNSSEATTANEGVESASAYYVMFKGDGG